MADFKFSLGFDELKSNGGHFFKTGVAEFIGNMILNLFAVGACTQPEDGLFKSLAFGLGVFIAICIIGERSGGHVNPAVTIALWSVGRISFLRAIYYVIAQCAGAIVGTWCIWILIDPDYHNGLGHTTLAPNVTAVQAVGIELFLGFLLVLTVMGVCDPYRRSTAAAGIAPLAIGMAVTLGHLGTIRYTGASMNPARTLGTAFFTENWTSHWVYWAGPISGGIAAAYAYLAFIANETEHEREDLAEGEPKDRRYKSSELSKLNTSEDFP